ncbi:MAG: hypothetical protein ACTSRS_18925 [Candidatus Helarchaeota archaeon]
MSFTDIFASAPMLIIILIALFGILTLLVKSKKARKMGMLCLRFTFFIIWGYLVIYVIMPTTGLSPISMDYQGLQLLLICLPVIYYLR